MTENNEQTSNGYNYGIFKHRHRDSRYMKWLKQKLDERETRDKLISFRNDMIEANKRVSYRNQIERMENEMQRDNLNQNSFDFIRTSTK